MSCDLCHGTGRVRAHQADLIETVDIACPKCPAAKDAEITALEARLAEEIESATDANLVAEQRLKLWRGAEAQLAIKDAELTRLREAVRDLREALAYMEKSGPGMSWNDVDHYWACWGCGERIIHPWREDRHVDHRPDCRFAVLARTAGLEAGNG